ncbi:MAG: amidohydrolase [Clostridiales bacterium]|nr:amidohydrolase [Clostridiales bacterium]
MSILIKNTNILTMVENTIVKGNILVEDNLITRIGEFDFEADEIIDGSNFITMPGIVNAHTHIAMSLLRNYADDLPFWPWLTEKIWPAEANLNEESVYWGSMLSIAEMIASGTTTFCDMYFFTEETIKAVKETGIRANLSRGLVSGEEEGEKLQNAINLHNEFHLKDEGRIRIDLGPHAPYTCSDDYLKKIAGEAGKRDTNIHIHLSESKKEIEDSIEKNGNTPIEHVNSLGLFDHPTIAAHCVNVNDDDIQILADKKVNVVNNPSSNLKLANGFAPVNEMMKKGINVALGTDGPSSNNNQDMFEEMHLAALVNKVISNDTTVLPAYEVLKMATVNGAKALRVDNIVGTLEVGKHADIILVDIHNPHMYPHHDLIASLVYSASSSDVDTVIVDGKILYQNKKFLTIDIETVYKKAQKASERLTGDKNEI